MTITVSNTIPPNIHITPVVDSFVATAGQVVFTLSTPVSNENYTTVFINGLYQQKSAYSIVGTVLTFDSPLTEGYNVEVIH